MPKFTARGEESYLIGSKLGQIIKIRFNGISGQCVERDGYTDARLYINVLMRRDLTTGSNIEQAEFYITAAIIDETETVVSRETFLEEANFRDSMDTSQPDIIKRLDIPDGHRVVLALGRAAE